MPRRNRAASATRFLLVFTACLLVVVFAAGWMIRRNIERTKSAAFDVASRVMDAIQIRPKVVVNHRTIVEQQSAVLQLVTVEKSLTERHRVDQSWLHSTKTLEVEADFVIRAGFDLARPFVIEIDRSSGTLHVTLPPAEILGVELRDVRFLRDEDGVWNKLTGEDRETAIRELRLRIQLNARQANFLREARAQAEKRLTDLLVTDGRTVIFDPERPR
jgi:hypothetical protein